MLASWNRFSGTVLAFRNLLNEPISLAAMRGSEGRPCSAKEYFWESFSTILAVKREELVRCLSFILP